MNFSDQESHDAHAASTHAVDILAFVEAREIPPDCFDTPYPLAPAPGGERIYALLRETLRDSGKIGIACVVIRSRQHLAAVVPQGQSLVLNTLRWARECFGTDDMVRQEELDLPDLETARLMAMAIPPAGGASAAAGIDLCQTVAPALEDQKMKAKKSERIIVEELEGLLDDDDFIDDDYLAHMLGRRLHPPDSHALRRAQSPRRFRTAGARRRR